MKDKYSFEKINTFSELVLIHSLLDQCENRKTNEAFVVKLESIGFSYLKHYVINYDDRKRLSFETDEIIFESISNIKNQLTTKGIEFSDYNSLLSIFKGDVKKQFLKVINNHIIPIVKSDIKKVFSKTNIEIIYSDAEEELGFPKEIVSQIKAKDYEIRNAIQKKIKNIDYSHLQTKPVYKSLDEILSVLYHTKDDSIGSMAKLHIFGIAYYEELTKMTTKEKTQLVIKATGKRSLLSEIIKGMALAKHVSINDIDKIPILYNSKYEHLKKKNHKTANF